MSMIKNICSGALLLLAVQTAPLAATCVENSIELRGAAFYHSDKLFRHIYGNASGCWEIEANARIRNHFALFANFDWFSKHGRSVGLREGTRINICNLSLGIKYFYPFWCGYTAYVGLGPSFGGVWINNHTHVKCHKHASKAVYGVVAKFGVCYEFTCGIFVDAFVDYLYQPVHFNKTRNIGGVKPGIGIGMCY